LASEVKVLSENKGTHATKEKLRVPLIMNGQY